MSINNTLPTAYESKPFLDEKSSPRLWGTEESVLRVEIDNKDTE
ncbi:hypothetical protein [Porphyromonas somerae]|uniref:Uncharacterized protein n=1 Tax=Porphyromonas somerae TaxID=322095 RepID=A0A134BEG1_9PORP|nr:hypothetical protein [Porphyromonas somerae]KXB77074.1 hypothetical protein HMPREF3184_00199 [Porphyromonadaceae bacterium KA00676]KXB78321.1 hypothetical protein HMPREF3185_00199 [Porphyromonas somerae]